MITKFITLALVALALTACQQQTAETGPTKVKVRDGNRFNVESFGYFRAGYGNNVREILVLTDTQTHRRYLSVTDCSLAEINDND